MMKYKGLWLPLTVFGIAFLAMLVGIFNQALLPNYSAYNFKRIVELVVLVLVACAILFSDSEQSSVIDLFNRLPIFSRWSLGVFFILGIISSGIATLPKYGFLGVGLYLLLLFTTFYVATLRQRYGQKFDTSLVVVMMICLFLYSCTSLHGYINCDNHRISFNYCLHFNRYMLPNFVNRRFFGQLQTWTLPLIVLPIILCPKQFKYLRALLYLFAGFWWMLAFVNQSRATLLLLPVAVVIVVLCCYGKKAFEWLLLQFISICIGILLYFILFSFSLFRAVSYFQNHLTRYANRLDLWQFTLQLIRKHPWLGVGPQNFSNYENLHAAHPHNAVLLLLVEWGIPAALFAIFIVLWGYFAWLKRARQSTITSHLAVSVALTATLTGGFVHALVSGVTVMPVSQFLLVIIAGWALGIYYTPPQIPNASVSLFSRLTLMVIVLLAIAAIIFGIFPPLIHIAGQMQHPPTGLFKPRFWHLGQLYIPQ